MASAATGDDLCEEALHKNQNWVAIEAYDASPRGSKSTEVATFEMSAPMHLFAASGSKQEINLPIDANLINRFDVICRFCLEEKERFIDIFDGSNQTVVMVESLFNIKIEDDMLPKRICTKCCELLNQFLAFKEQVMSADIALRRCIDQLKQVEIETQEEDCQAFSPSNPVQHTLNAKSAINELDAFYKFEDLIEEEYYTGRDEMVFEKAENFYSEYDKKPIVGEVDAVYSPEVKSESVASPSEVISLPANEQSKSRTPIKCELCERAFSNNSFLQRHIKSHAMKKLKNQCRVRSKSICRATDLKGNMPSRTSPNEALQEQPNAFKCDKCNESFAVEHDLYIHGSIHSQDENIRCRQCGKEFLKLTSLQRHVKVHYEKKSIKVHSGKKRHRCSKCSKSFGMSSELATHVCTQTDEKPHKCSHCSKTFVTPSKLAIHFRTHTGEKPYICRYCSKSFGSSSNLDVHIRTHVGEKPFKCSDCSKTFGTSSSLTMHVRTHTGEKPFKCSQCPKAFREFTTLTGHVRTHTGEKPFNCNVCDKSFRLKWSLIMHMRMHSDGKPHKCPNCSKSFVSSSRLARHVRTHTGEKPFKCSDCSKAYGTASELKRHARTHTRVK